VVFSSTAFLFLFLPAVLVVYFALPRRFRNLALIAAGFIFYAWGAGNFVFVVALSTLADWALGLGVQRARRNGEARRAALLLVLAIGQNLGLLFYYKYSDFLLTQLTDAFVKLGFGDHDPRRGSRTSAAAGSPPIAGPPPQPAGTRWQTPLIPARISATRHLAARRSSVFSSDSVREEGRSPSGTSSSGLPKDSQVRATTAQPAASRTHMFRGWGSASSS
jgi:hypothetical protein